MVISEMKICIQNYRLAGDSCFIAHKHSDLQSASDFEIIFQQLIAFWFLAIPIKVLQHTLLVYSALFIQLQTSTFI